MRLYIIFEYRSGSVNLADYAKPSIEPSTAICAYDRRALLLTVTRS